MNNTIVTAEPSMHVVEVTPELAKEWLGLNTANRTLKQHQVRAYAEDMIAGRWHLNGEAIKFSGSREEPAKLLDGQNRLHALVKAQVTVRMFVGYGFASDSQQTMDSGAKRTVADDLQINGRSHATVVAAAANIALHVESNRIAGGARFTNASIRAFVDAHRDLEQSAEAATKYARRADVAPAMVAYTHWVLSKLDYDEATAFWRDASEKTGLQSGDPVIALTNRFAEARRNREKLPRVAQLSIIYRAWNARRAGKPMRVAKVNSVKGGLIEIPEPR